MDHLERIPSDRWRLLRFEPDALLPPTLERVNDLRAGHMSTWVN